MNRRLIIPILGLCLIILGTILAIKIAQGYRPDIKNPKALKGTGLLVANSFPSGGQVFLNTKLTTATDDTLNLPPGEYQVEIKKDGFSPWSKKIRLEAELVTQTNATLFPTVPSLKPLTFTGAINPLPSPDGQKIVYAVTQASNPAQNGLWVLDLNPSTPFSRKEPRQIARSNGIDFDTATLSWSPDGSQIIVHLDKNNFLLDATRFNDTPELKDITARLSLILSEWEERLTRKQQQQLLTLPKSVQDLILQNVTNLYFSPDETKLLYTATKAFSLPDHLIPPLPASSTQIQSRDIVPKSTYVYDLKEDRNFKIADPPPAELGNPKLNPEKLLLVHNLSDQLESSPSAFTKLQNTANIPQVFQAFTAQYTPLLIQPVQWFPNSTHLISLQENKITIMEYDNQNQVTIYSGNFEPGFAYPSPNGSQLIMLANLNQDSQLPPNLYAIDLK